MISLRGLFAGPERDFKKTAATKEEAARILKTRPEALEAFTAAYEKRALGAEDSPGSPFGISSKQAARMHREASGGAGAASQGGDPAGDEAASAGLVSRIIAELAAQTPIYTYNGEKAYYRKQALLTEREGGTGTVPAPVMGEEIMTLPEPLRPQLTGDLMKKDIGEPSYPALIAFYRLSKTAKTARQRQQAYHQFRQGLDILDLDCVTYEILGMNRNSMGHWLPPLVGAVMG